MKYMYVFILILFLIIPVSGNVDSNIAPHARIDYDQQTTTIVYFDSGNSFDEDGFILKNTWCVVGLDDKIDSEVYQFVVPHVFDRRSYLVELTVTDNNGATDYDAYNVYVDGYEITHIEACFLYEEDIKTNIDTEETVEGFGVWAGFIGFVFISLYIKNQT